MLLEHRIRYGCFCSSSQPDYILTALPLPLLNAAHFQVTDKPPTPKKTKDKLQKPMATSGQVDMSHFLDVMLESGGAVSILKELAKSEAKLEEGKGLTARSPLLQALVQVSLKRDLYLKELL